MSLVLAYLLLACLAQEPSPAPESRSETRFSLSLADEGAWAAGMRVPGARTGNLLLLQPSFNWKYADRWHFTSSLAAIATTSSETHASLRVKETYLGVTAGDFDFSAGKRILKWGTGYAFTPTGVLDPPRSALDPTDRLSLNEGREMVTGEWVSGRHALTAAWASAGLTQAHQPGMRETAAVRYNTLLAGFDTSLVLARDRGRATFAGANFTRVFGEAIEVHGEIAHRGSTALLLGGKYATRSGVSAIFEFYAPDGVRRFGFINASKSRLRELPGWKEWDADASLVANLRDRGRIIIFNVTRRLGNRFSATLRSEMPAGKKWRSEYGMIPYAARVSAGLRVQL